VADELNGVLPVAQVIRFFPKKVLAADASPASFYSEIYEIQADSNLTAELRVFGTISSAGVASGILEGSDDPILAQNSWSQMGAPLAVTGVGQDKQNYTNLLRFVRAKVTLPANTYMTVSFEAIGREQT
jgi:hypothetical protein